MPFAVTHILLPILAVSLVRDFILSRNSRARFPLHYVFFAGLGGVLPDIDIPISVILRFLGEQSWWIHKTFTHSLFFPLAFLIVFLVLRPFHERFRVCHVRKHRLDISMIALVLFVGILVHLALDLLFGNQVYLLYPFLTQDFGLNLFSFEGFDWSLIAALVDGVLLVLYLAYLEFRHKISDYV